MQIANGVGVSFQLSVVVVSGHEHHLLGIYLASCGNRQAQFDLVGWRIVAQRFLLHDFRGSRGIHFIRSNLRSARRIVSSLKAENGEPAIGGQSGKKQTELAVLVVDQLASDRQMQVAGPFAKIVFSQIRRCLAQIEDAERWAIFAVAVG